MTAASNMPLFQGTKTIRAKPMTRGDYNALRGWQVPADEDPTDDGYLVEYTDGGRSNVEGFAGYVSWSPADVFERSYKPCGTHVDRMAVELGELSARIQKLYAFMSGPGPYADLSDDEKALLGAQQGSMLAYEGILVLRFNRAMKASASPG